MRLIYCTLDVAPHETLIRLELQEYLAEPPRYAILSHRWGENELIFPDIRDGLTLTKGKGYEKITGCCEQAIRDGYEYVWIDTCCIDKSSSAELSEAINSMYLWYTKSNACYAYLSDFPEDTGIGDYIKEEPAFKASSWFKRGWTLQELIAPSTVTFYTKHWGLVGTKSDMADLIHDITRIDVDVLKNHRDHPISIAKIMSWAAGRETTRTEDRAYSLMGLFGVNMPPLYGEGPNAFIRLQQEVMRTTYDHSLFAWKLSGADSRGLLAASPDEFADAGDVVLMDYNQFAVQFGNKDPSPEYESTNFGIRIQLPLERVNNEEVYRAYLACIIQGSDTPVSIILKGSPGAAVDTYERVAVPSSSLKRLPLAQRSYIPVKRIYISSPNTLLKAKPAVNPELDIHFTIDPQDFATPPSAFRSKLLLSYHSGASIKNATEPFFTIRFRQNLNDQYVVLCLGELQGLASLEADFIRLFVVVGWYRGKIWTDITGGKLASVTSIYKGYKDINNPPGSVREKGRTTYKLKFSFEENRPAANLKVAVRKDSVQGSRDSYTATVNFSWT